LRSSERFYKGVAALRIRCSDEVDVVTLELREGRPVDSIDLTEGVILILDEKGAPLEIEILDASKVVDLERVSWEVPKAGAVKSS
jgi:uncharacterized protein YuzE